MRPPHSGAQHSRCQQFNDRSSILTMQRKLKKTGYIGKEFALKKRVFYQKRKDTHHSVMNAFNWGNGIIRKVLFRCCLETIYNAYLLLAVQ